MYRPTHQNSVEFSSSVILWMKRRSEVPLQPTREQFEFVLVAEEQQDEETQGGDDGQHGNDDTRRRRSCKAPQKNVTRLWVYHIFS